MIFLISILSKREYKEVVTNQFGVKRSLCILMGQHGQWINRVAKWQKMTCGRELVIKQCDGSFGLSYNDMWYQEHQRNSRQKVLE